MSSGHRDEAAVDGGDELGLVANLARGADETRMSAASCNYICEPRIKASVK